MTAIREPVNVTCTCTVPYRLDSALPCVVTGSFVVSRVAGTSEVD
ncbi:hypothetical protein GCM10017567_50440 [Amycolatopsis bullii]|uniref:Uncharacterized protein n=1 Tax=Amycolatopsis bullii TaxID=941987 RepID=A0ABQ3KNX7_9PSEU|nr:hypothetical protein GCM10017567_50440 [Amycolatopsis bullii]